MSGQGLREARAHIQYIILSIGYTITDFKLSVNINLKGQDNYCSLILVIYLAFRGPAPAAIPYRCKRLSLSHKTPVQD